MGSMVYGVVADGLLALGREVEESGGDEVWGLEDLEVALGGVVAFGAVDDGLGGGVPGDLLEGEEVVPAVVDELPEGRGAGAARLVDGRHRRCS